MIGKIKLIAIAKSVLPCEIIVLDFAKGHKLNKRLQTVQTVNPIRYPIFSYRNLLPQLFCYIFKC